MSTTIPEPMDRCPSTDFLPTFESELIDGEQTQIVVGATPGADAPGLALRNDYFLWTCDMDNDFAKLLRRDFLQALAEKLPQFEPQGGKGKVQTSGWRSFLWTVADDLHFFIGLGVDAQGHAFVVEGAWSEQAEYPSGSGSQLISNLAKDAASQGRLSFQAAAQDGGQARARRWQLKPAAVEAEIRRQIDEAVRMIQTEFVPLFLRRAAARGIRLGGQA